jgi:rare lipoprotein A
MSGFVVRAVAHAVILVAAGLLLSACGTSSTSAIGPRASGGQGYRVGQPSYKVGAAYQINGVWYYPKVDYNYDETGTASWYGEAFDQQPTANGEIFDLNQPTAAHKTLPLPSIVEVTNLQNGRAMRLRVNDRGPFVSDRVIDLSRRAAQLLGFERAGTANVRVRILKEESVQVAEAAKRGSTGAVAVASASAPVAVASVAPMPRSLPRAPEASPPPVIERNIATTPLPPVQPASPPVVPPPAAPPPVAVATTAPPPANPAPPTRQWPSLIASAHAESYNPSPAPVTNALRPEPERAVPMASSGRIFVQAGAFSVPENAQRVRSRLASLGNAQVMSTTVKGAPLYRVRVGPVSTVEEADRLAARIVGTGLPDARVVTE